MVIGIDGSRAFLRRRTGIEEYSYQVIRHLRGVLTGDSVIVYIRSDQEIDFELPEHWQVKKLWAPRLWTQVRLSVEMLLRKPDVLLVPAHTVPVIHPKHTVVVVHGLEYEFCPEAYSWWERIYMRWSIRYSVAVASRVVCVSENTKRDVMRLYGVSEGKISVVYEGYDPKRGTDLMETARDHEPYFLFVGRIEERKNIATLIHAFGLLKQGHAFTHRLVLSGKPGYGYEHIARELEESPVKDSIVETGYVSEEEKWRLLRGADAFVFPTLYEGFGIPILEAQSVGVPVIASDNSSIPEVAGDAALLVDPRDVTGIAEAMRTVISDQELREKLILRGRENVRRFGWEKCAQALGRELEGSR